MRDSLIAALACGLVFGSSMAVAQVQPIPEAQLERGFLGEQNDRLTKPGESTDVHYATRAAVALAEKDYARTLAILRPYRRTREVAYYYLAGRAHQGLGDYASARKELAAAIRKEQSFIGAQLALGLLEAEHGDRAEALRILAGLKDRQTRCAGQCRDVADLGAAVDAIEAALRNRPA